MTRKTSNNHIDGKVIGGGGPALKMVNGPSGAMTDNTFNLVAENVVTAVSVENDGRFERNQVDATLRETSPKAG